MVLDAVAADCKFIAQMGVVQAGGKQEVEVRVNFTGCCNRVLWRCSNSFWLILWPTLCADEAAPAHNRGIADSGQSAVHAKQPEDVWYVARKRRRRRRRVDQGVHYRIGGFGGGLWKEQQQDPPVHSSQFLKTDICAQHIVEVHEPHQGTNWGWSTRMRREIWRKWRI